MFNNKESIPRYRVITDIHETPGSFWAACTEYCPTPEVPAFLKKILGGKLSSIISAFLLAIRLMIKRRKANALITTSGTGTILFACLQTIFPRGRKPHVMLDCLWYRFPNRFKQRVFSWMLQLAARSVKKFIVWESHEIEDYAETFGVPAETFEYIPFWHTIGQYNFEVTDQGYVFAGGNWNRDYAPVLQAARQMPDVPFLIGTTRPEQFEGLDIPTNVTVNGYTHEGFRQAIAGCSIMVVPMIDGLLHTGGQQTALNAMYMGKPVIAIGRPWSSDIICDGEDGLIVDFDDEKKFQYGLKWLWSDPDSRQLIGQKAAQVAQARTPRRSLNEIYRLTLDLYNAEPIFFDQGRELSPDYFLKEKELQEIVGEIEEEIVEETAIEMDDVIKETIEKIRKAFNEDLSTLKAKDITLEKTIEDETVDCCDCG